MPGAPSSSWALYRARLAARFEGVHLRIGVSFWLFGLINNFFYVVILTAALDLVGPSIPKATVLLASVIPGLATKIVTPYIIHLVPYSVRIVVLAALSTCGMLSVALSPDDADAASLAGKVAGIVLANISSGAGEVNFIGLTHFYGETSLAAWSSGTGGAGLIGAGAYALATTTFGFSVRGTLVSSALLPAVMLLSFFAILPRGALRAARRQEFKYRQQEDENTEHSSHSESAGLLDSSNDQATVPTHRTGLSIHAGLDGLRARLLRARSLVIPYMLPLFLVYVAEYTINQGVAPTLLFPLSQTPFKRYRAFYPTYAAIYQLGVFISRSSLPFIRIRSLYIPTFLQILNLAALTLHTMYPFIPTVWYVFAIITWEGLLGGLVYVSTFAAIREETPEEDREFCLGATSTSDSAGIFAASLLGMVMETALCNWQVNHGRDWCRQL